MSDPTIASETAANSRVAHMVATAFGLGYVPVAPGTAGALAGVALFALPFYTLDNFALGLVFIIVSLALLMSALWSTERALPQWSTPDPSQVVIDEVFGQFLTYGGPLVVVHSGLAELTPGWKILLAGFIFFRIFDVLKPYPIRQSEKIPGASGIVMDDFLAAVYGALALGLMSWAGWLG